MPAVGGAVLRGLLGGTWRTWSGVNVRKSGAWVPAEYVYAFHGGEWHLVWANAPVNPSNVVAAITGPSQITITWDPPDPEAAASYNVYRPNGTLVGSVSATGASSYMIVDNAAVPWVGSQSYVVKSVIGAALSSGANSNALAYGEAPASVVATPSNVGVDTNVNITWDAVAGASFYRVYRGAVGSNLLYEGPALTLDLTNPVAFAGSYYVVGVFAGANGQGGASNAVTLAQAPTGLTVDSVTGDDVALSWSLAASGDHDDVQVLRNGSVLATLAAGTTSYTDTNSLEGTQPSYTVRTRVSENAGPASTAAVASVAANPPTSVNCIVSGALGELILSWGTPAGGWTNYTVAWSDNGVSWSSGVIAGGSPVAHTFTGGSGARYMRVRTNSPGGSSAWVQCSATPAWDNTPPALPSITSWKPEALYGRLVLRFTTSSSDNYQVSVELSVNDGIWVTAVGWTGVGNSQAVAFHIVTGTANNKYEVRVRVRDQYLNTSGYTSVVYYTLRPEVQDVIPNAMGHWRDNVWGGNGSDPDRPFQGYFSNPAYNYVGLFYYGTQWRDLCNAQSSFGGKITVTGMKCVFARQGGGVNQQDAVGVGLHSYTGKPANGSVGGIEFGIVSDIVTLAYGEAKEPWLTADHIHWLSNGLSFGICMVQFFGKPYMSFYKGEEYGFQGWGKIYSLG